MLQKLGKFTTGKSCLYIKHLSDVHVPMLKKLIQAGIGQAFEADSSGRLEIERKERERAG